MYLYFVSRLDNLIDTIISNHMNRLNSIRDAYFFSLLCFPLNIKPIL